MTTPYPKSIRTDAAHFLPPSLVGRRLEPDEATVLTAALVQLLDRGVNVAAVMYALGESGNQALIPRLTEEVQRQVGRDAWAIHQGAYVLEDLLYVPPGQRRLRRLQVATFEHACAALAVAVTVDLPYPPSSPERSYVPDPREAVTQVLAVLCDRFQPTRRRRGFGRWRSGDRLRMRVEQVDVLSSGDLELHGQLHADVNQPQLQARALVTAPGQAPRDAAFIGLHFNIGAWPPQRSVLLRGVSAAGVPPGSLISAVDTEERELLTGINRGDLQRVDYENPWNAVGQFDYVMANPPFNVNKIDKTRLEGDKRFPFDLPRADNGNYIRIQLFYSALNSGGRAGFVMANSAADASGSELEIRRKLI